METFGMYSLKAGIILVLFWGIYCLFLQKETFYRFNRFFLLTGLIAALILPLITIRYAVEISASSIPVHLISDLPVVAEAGAINNLTLANFLNVFLPIFYLVILCIILIVRSIGLSRLLKTIRKHNHKQYSGYNIVESSEFDGAFSFFRFVFIPPDLNESEKHIILKHEEAHITQRHWIDLFLTNMLSLIWWFNPVVRFYEKAIRNNHEFLADQEVLIDYQHADYQQTLVNQWFKTPVYPMVNSFSYSNRLKRINMMKKKLSNPVKKLFSLAAIPAIAMFLLAFSEKDYIISDPNLKIITTPEFPSDKNSSTDNGRFEIAIKNEMKGQNGAIEMTANTREKAQSPKDNKPANNDITHSREAFTEIDGSIQDSSILVIIDGEKRTDGLKELDPKEIDAVTVLKDKTAVEKYGEEGKAGVIEVITKKYRPADTNTTQENEKINSVKDPTITIIGYGSMNNVTNDALKLNSSNTPLYIIDGEIKDDIQNINPENIFSISVLKNQTATEIYGEKGKNGVILITTKEGQKIKELLQE